MPGNIVRVNNNDDLEWYVGDSKMEEMILFLDKIGYTTNDDYGKAGTVYEGTKNKKEVKIDRIEKVEFIHHLIIMLKEIGEIKLDADTLEWWCQLLGDIIEKELREMAEATDERGEKKPFKEDKRRES